EIIVVDDASTPPLANKLEGVPPHCKMKVLRHNESLGLMIAKQTGGDAASGAYIGFYDCHVAPAKNWYKETIDLLAAKERRLVVPMIADLDLDTWDEKVHGALTAKCYINFNADFWWYEDESDFIPVISGGLVATTRKWWQDSGGFDPGMRGWGGENTDQSLRAWLCGGDILRARSSHVAHMWRVDSDPRTLSHYHLRHRTDNLARVAAIWFGEFKDKFRDGKLVRTLQRRVMAALCQHGIRLWNSIECFDRLDPTGPIVYFCDITGQNQNQQYVLDTQGLIRHSSGRCVSTNLKATSLAATPCAGARHWEVIEQFVPAETLRYQAAVTRYQLREAVGGFPLVSPSTQGFAEVPLTKLKEAVKNEVSAGALAGAAHMVLRRGRCVLAHADGFANVRAKRPFGLRTLCRLHGCTKPLVAAAFLTLVDKGKVKLSDPISKYIPFSEEVSQKKGRRRKPLQLKARKVKVRPTLRHLLTMTAGLQYQDCRAYAKTMRGIQQRQIKTLAAMCEGLAAQPLQNEPGSCYTYSFCTDMIGRVCEAVSGKRLDKFMQSALLAPLGMQDTYFEVPAKKRKREAVLYDCQRSGGSYVPKVWSQPEKAVPIMSGGGGILTYNDPGMWSTIEDYAKFCHMLFTGKSRSGARILRPETVKALWSDSLAKYGQKDGRLPGWHDADGKAKGGHWDYTGWSLLNTHLTFKQMPSPSKRARVGQTMWMGGGGGTFWVVDKRNETIAISFSQSFGGRGSLTDTAKDASVFVEAALQSR
ncbi:unnamed protein product, partial [Symbiodinium pilosum]